MFPIKIFAIFLALAFQGGACKESDSEEEESQEKASVESAASEADTKSSEPNPVPVSPPKKSGTQLTCGQRGIPSWESAIADLVSARCEKCHSQKLAYKGILLLTYKDMVDNQEKSRGRIQTNSLTEPLDPTEQQFFMDFFKAGLPEKETDCKDAAT